MTQIRIKKDFMKEKVPPPDQTLGRLLKKHIFNLDMVRGINCLANIFDCINLSVFTEA